MTLSRRKALALVGGGVVLAATGGAALAVTRRPTRSPPGGWPAPTRSRACER